MNELKDLQLTDEEDEDIEYIDAEIFKEQDGGNIAYLDESEDENDENGFHIQLG